nr:MAG TPA: arsenate reductase [Caudoviricetes sp.]
MVIISTNPKNQLLQKVKEELDFLGVNYEIKKSWTDELIKQCFINNFEFCSGHYMSQIRNLNFEQALEMIHKNPKMLRKFIVINGNKAIADFPKVGLIRKQLKGLIK